MKRAAAKIVLKLLNFKQKQRLMDIVQDLLEKFITGDESWLYAFDIETKMQSSQLKAFC